MGDGGGVGSAEWVSLEDRQAPPFRSPESLPTPRASGSPYPSARRTTVSGRSWAARRDNGALASGAGSVLRPRLRPARPRTRANPFGSQATCNPGPGSTSLARGSSVPNPTVWFNAGYQRGQNGPGTPVGTAIEAKPRGTLMNRTRRNRRAARTNRGSSRTMGRGGRPADGA